MNWNTPIPTERGLAFLVPLAASLVVAFVARFTVSRPRRSAAVITPEYVVLRWPRRALLPLMALLVGSSLGLPMLFDPGVPRAIAMSVVWALAVGLAFLLRRDYREEFRVGPSELVRIAPSGRRTVVRWENVRLVGYFPGQQSHFYVEAGDRERTRLRIGTGIDGAGDLADALLAHAPPSAFFDQGATRVMRKYAQEARAERGKSGN